MTETKRPAGQAKTPRRDVGRDKTAIREQFYRLFRDDPKRKQRIHDHEAIAGIREALDEWNAHEPSYFAYNEDEPTMGEILPDLIPRRYETMIADFCDEELSKLGITDQEFRDSLIFAWKSTAFTFIDPTGNHVHTDHSLYFRSTSHWVIDCNVAFEYVFPSSIRNYSDEKKRIDDWIANDVKPVLMSRIEFLKTSFVGRPRKLLTKQVHAMFRFLYTGDDKSLVSREVFGLGDNRKSIDTGIAYIREVLQEDTDE